MELQGSCRCGSVRFSLLSHTPCPYMRCYCSICRKISGCGGYAINIMGQNDTLNVEGREHVQVYRVLMPGAHGNMEPSSNGRYFCVRCGTHLWAYDKTWGQWVYPFAGAIDTDLPNSPHTVHMMLGSKASWVEPQVQKGDKKDEEYPELGIEEWHKKNGVYIE